MRNSDLEKLLLRVIPISAVRGKAYLVGGYVRDLLMRRESKDIDITVEEKDGAELLGRFIHNVFEVETTAPFKKGAHYPIWSIVFTENVYYGGLFYEVKDMVLDIADTQKETFEDPYSRQRVVQYGTLEDDIKRRDFTVNMLMKDLTTGEIKDPCGCGISDAEDRILRGHPEVDLDQTFADDPLRMLRLVRFICILNMYGSLAVLRKVKKNSNRLEIISEERKKEELVKIMEAGKLSRAIRLCKALGILKYILPDIQALVGVTQPKEFHSEGDAFEHTMLALDKLEDKSIVNQLSVLLHDSGKAKTWVIESDGRIHFYGHEDESEKIAEVALRRLTFDLDTIDKVKKIVRNHMRPHDVYQWSFRAVRKFIRDTDGVTENIIAVSMADERAAIRQDGTVKDGACELQALIEKAKAIPIRRKPILNGNTVMEVLGIKPGKEVGDVMNWLIELEDDLAEHGEELTQQSAMVYLQARRDING